MYNITDSDLFFRKKIKYLSFVLAVFVIFIHSNNLSQYGMQPDSMSYRVEMGVNNSITPGATAAYMFVSGVLYFVNYYEKGAKYKLKSRIKSILLPYLCWNTIYTFIAAVCSILGFSEKLGDNWSMNPINISNVFKGIFLYDHNPIFWFVFYLIVISFLSPLLYPVINNRRWGGAFILAVEVINNLSGRGYFSVRMSLYFVVGGYLAIHFKEKLFHRNKHLGISVLFVVIFIINGIIYMHCMDNYIISNIYPWLYIISVWNAADLVTVKNREIKWFMDYTFMIYAMQLLMLAPLKKIGRIVLPLNDTFAVVTFFVIPVFSVFAICNISRLIKTISPNTYGVLSGGR